MSAAGSRRKSAPPASVGGVVKEILQVFVDSLPHVPAHRRLPLLTHLLISVGAEGAVEGQLHTTIGLLLEKQVVGTEVRQLGSTAIDRPICNTVR